MNNFYNKLWFWLMVMPMLLAVAVGCFGPDRQIVHDTIIGLFIFAGISGMGLGIGWIVTNCI